MNAKEELQRVLLWREIAPEDFLCAEILYLPLESEEESALENRAARLPLGWGAGELHAFWRDLDFDHPYGFGEIEGTVWLKNGSWLKYRCFDGSEYWELQEPPQIPSHLRR